VNTPTEANALRAGNTELRYYGHDTKAGYAFLAAGREFIPAFTVRLEINSLGARALLPIPSIVKEQLPIPEYDDH